MIGFPEATKWASKAAEMVCEAAVWVSKAGGRASEQSRVQAAEEGLIVERAMRLLDTAGRASEEVGKTSFQTVLIHCIARLTVRRRS